jgi:phage recombination protein Bet
MSQAIATTNGNGGIINAMAAHYEMEPARFFATIKATVFPQGKEVSNEQAAAFLVVAKQYNLNPFIKEIYAFPGRAGGVVPIVSVDGWATLINRQEQLDGIQFEDRFDENLLIAVTCRIYRKDRTHPTEVTEYMEECRRDTDTWRKWPARMLRHKALIQCARYAFGLVGIYDPDEAERIASGDPESSAAPVPLAMPTRKSEAPPIDAEVVSDSESGPADILEFNPLAEVSGDYPPQKDIKKITDLCAKLSINADETAAKFFKVPELKVDDLNQEAVRRLSADLKARLEAA